MRPLFKTKRLKHLLLWGGATITTASFLLPSPSHAKAEAGINSNITINAKFPKASLKAPPKSILLPKPGQKKPHDDWGFAFGNAHSTHTSEVINKKTFEDDDFIEWQIATDLHLNVDAAAPWGIAYAEGYAHTGLEFQLIAPAVVSFAINPQIDVFAKTTKPNETALAFFHYDVTLDGNIIKDPITNIPLSATKRFKHQDGICKTVVCTYVVPPPNAFIYSPLLGVGLHKLIIDPDGGNQGVEPAPAPLPILGTALAFGSVRKLKRLSTHIKAFSMG